MSLDYRDVNHRKELTGPFIIVNVYFDPLNGSL